MSDDDPAPPLSRSAQYALWLDLVRGRLTEQQAAARHDLDVSDVRRIRQVAEQAALSALSSATTDTTAQISSAGSPARDARGRVVDLLSHNPVFFDVPDERRHDLARHATLAFLGRATPIADGLAAGPLLVAAGTIMAIDRQGRPVDLIGAGVFRAPRAGRRLRSVTDARVVALPAAAADDAVATTRARLAAARPFGGHRAAVGGPNAPRLTTGVLADLLSPHVPAPSLESRTPLTPSDTPLASSDTPLLDALRLMLASGAHEVRVTDGDRVVGTVADEDLPLPVEAGLSSLLDVLADAGSVEALTGVRTAARGLARSVLEAGADVTEVGRLLAEVGDHVVRRLLTIAVDELGTAPAAFAWLVFGSHARGELTPGSDQDTGLVHQTGLDDEGRQWFADLGSWMTAALEACGYRRCGGGVMRRSRRGVTTSTAGGAPPRDGPTRPTATGWSAPTSGSMCVRSLAPGAWKRPTWRTGWPA